MHLSTHKLYASATTWKLQILLYIMVYCTVLLLSDALSSVCQACYWLGSLITPTLFTSYRIYNMPLGWNERHDGNSEWPQFDKNCIGLPGMCLLTFPDHEIQYYPSKINFSHIHKIYSKEMHSWASKSRGFILRFSLFCFHLAMKLVKLDWEGFFLSRNTDWW